MNAIYGLYCNLKIGIFMKIINGLVILLSITQILSAKSSSEFKLDVGTEQTILLGDILDLKGEVLSGDKNKIDHYQWEENGKVIKNTSGDGIVYWDDANAENGHAPKSKGNHILKFVVVDTAGKKHIKRLLVKVETKDNVYISENDMKFDIKSDFPVKREKRSEGNYRLSRGHYLDVKVGDVIPLSGVISSSKKHLVDFYSWELKGKVIQNQLHDDLIYWDEENRENDYVLTKPGQESLEFVVTDINGGKTKKTLLLKIVDKSGKDDHGNTMATATEIPLNKGINATHETYKDNDFFKFTIEKKQNVKVIMDQKGPRKVKVLSADGKIVEIKYISVPASGGMYRVKTQVFEPGTYYVNVNRDLGDYTLEVQAFEVNPVDNYGNTRATSTNVLDGTTIDSYMNSTKDVDYFYFMPKADGTVSIKPTGVPKVDIGGEYTYGDPIKVKRGKKMYFKVHLGSRTYGIHPYSFSLSFKK